MLDGALEVLIASRWRTMTAGETAAVSAGTVHSFRGAEAVPSPCRAQAGGAGPAFPG